jgi:hypothetical protein
MNLSVKLFTREKANGFNCDDDLPFRFTGISMSADRAFQPIQRRFSFATQPYEAIGMPPQICTTVRRVCLRGPCASTINFSDPLSLKHFRPVPFTNAVLYRPMPRDREEALLTRLERRSVGGQRPYLVSDVGTPHFGVSAPFRRAKAAEHHRSKTLARW